MGVDPGRAANIILPSISTLRGWCSHMLRSYVRLFRGATPYQPLSQIRRFHATFPPKARSNHTTPNDDESAPVKRKRGRPRKNDVAATVEDTSENGTNPPTSKPKPQPSTPSETKPTAQNNNSEPAPTKPKRSRPASHKTPPNPLPPRLHHPSPHHTDLPSFHAYANRTKDYKNSTLYKGTLYEYTTIAALARLNFTLHRTGRANDLGIDLVGHWHLPSSSSTAKAKGGPPREMKVLAQCKSTTPTPAMIRELEGAYAGAPAGWRGEGVLGLLVASKEATRGVRGALRRSRWPLGLVLVTEGGGVRQFLWNAVAEECGLGGLGVGVRFVDGSGSGGRVEGGIVMTWMGEVWEGGGGGGDVK